MQNVCDAVSSVLLRSMIRCGWLGCRSRTGRSTPIWNIQHSNFTKYHRASVEHFPGRGWGQNLTKKFVSVFFAHPKLFKSLLHKLSVWPSWLASMPCYILSQNLEGVERVYFYNCTSVRFINSRGKLHTFLILRQFVYLFTKLVWQMPPAIFHNNEHPTRVLKEKLWETERAKLFNRVIL